MTISDFRQELVHLLETKLLPRLKESGFQSFELSQAESSDRQFATAFPLGFHRRANDGGYDLIDIQFDPRGDAKFTINAAHVSSAGFELPWGKTIDREDAHATDALSYVRLVDGPGRRRWFGARLFACRSTGEATKIVERAIDKYSEIEDWFRSGNIGRNLEKRIIR